MDLDRQRTLLQVKENLLRPRHQVPLPISGLLKHRTLLGGRY